MNIKSDFDNKIISYCMLMQTRHIHGKLQVVDKVSILSKTNWCVGL